MFRATTQLCMRNVVIATCFVPAGRVFVRQEGLPATLGLPLQVTSDLTYAIEDGAALGIAQRHVTPQNFGIDRNGRGVLYDYSAGKVCHLCAGNEPFCRMS